MLDLGIRSCKLIGNDREIRIYKLQAGDGVEEMVVVLLDQPPQITNMVVKKGISSCQVTI